MCLTKQEHSERRITDINLSSASKNALASQGGGKGILITKDKAFTLATTPIDAVCYDARGNGEGGVSNDHRRS